MDYWIRGISIKSETMTLWHIYKTIKENGNNIYTEQGVSKLIEYPSVYLMSM
jgi:hypothetical protein